MTAVAPIKSSEQIAWEFFISKGFSAEQTAGILGNLEQEHGFNTDDVPSGLGIAQWLGARRDRLLAKDNHLDFKVQLNFIIEELNDTEKTAHNAVRSAGSITQATIAFQNLYERCHPAYCMQNQRIQYAHTFYNQFR